MESSTDKSRTDFAAEMLQRDADSLRDMAALLADDIKRFQALLSAEVISEDSMVEEQSRLGINEEDLAQQLHMERERLAAAWEQLEVEQRQLLARSSDVQQPRKPVSVTMPTLPTCDGRSISKRNQFQYLQQECDRATRI